MSEDWETFSDSSYFDLWRVRRKNERGFNDGYHLQNGEEAKALVELLNRVEQERDEALMDRASGDMATMTRNHYERLIKERDEARADAARIADKLSGLELRSTEELARLERERNKALTTIEDAKRALNATDYEDILLAALRVKEERDEARQRASDLELTRAAYDEVEKLEDQEAPL